MIKKNVPNKNKYIIVLLHSHIMHMKKNMVINEFMYNSEILSLNHLKNKTCSIQV